MLSHFDHEKLVELKRLASIEPNRLLGEFSSSEKGLISDQVGILLKQYGPNAILVGIQESALVKFL